MFCRRFIALLLCLLAWPYAIAAESLLRVAVTTSLENSGLARLLVDSFEQEHPIKLHIIATGTGKALRQAKDGNVDLIIVHDPESERSFVKDGYGLVRQPFMYNEFVVLGPAHDPAGISSLRSIEEVFQKLSNKDALFVSRGDDSGTHKMELRIWRQLGISPNPKNYRETGLGMARMLQVASELGAYTLSDNGTWLAVRQNLKLRRLFRGDPLLRNIYSAIAINPDKYPQTQQQQARRLMDWLLSENTKNLIASYQKYGETLFFPFVQEH